MDLAETPILIANGTHGERPAALRRRDLLALSDDDSPLEDRIAARLQGADLGRLDRPAEADPVRRAGRDVMRRAAAWRLPDSATT